MPLVHFNTTCIQSDGFKYYNMCIERCWPVRIVPAMENWIALVKAKMRELDITQEKLAERIGVTQGAVGHWLRRERQPKLETMNRILVELGMPHLHVQMQLTSRSEVAEQGASYAPHAQDPDYVRELLQYIVCFRYPVLAWTELEGELPEDSIVHEHTDYCARGRAFWLRVESDAMNAPSGPSVPEGMLVLVDPGVPAAPGKLVIVRQTGRPAIFRQLIEEGGQRYLRPLNPTYPTVLCEQPPQVLGVVVRAHASF